MRKQGLSPDLIILRLVSLCKPNVINYVKSFSNEQHNPARRATVMLRNYVVSPGILKQIKLF